MDYDKAIENTAKLLEVIDELLGKNGCPWDRKQTTNSLTKDIIEETYELVDAIERKNIESITEELGDLFFLILFVGHLVEKEYDAEFHTSVKGVIDKLVRRHPHVFSGLKIKDENEILVNWEKIKKTEKPRKKILEGIPLHLPALLKAYRIQEKLERFQEKKEELVPREKIQELSQKLEHIFTVKNKEIAEKKYGEFLFELVNAARRSGIESEKALQNENELHLKKE